MIRFLQRDNRLTKALFVVIIAAASVSMVVYLIPGLTGTGATSADTYAVIYPHWYSRFLSSGDVVTQQKVNQIARQQVSLARVLAGEEMLQGLDDPIVPPSQSEAIARDLAAHGIRYAYIGFAGESHGFRKAETIIASLEAELAFYGEIFGFTPPGVPPIELL